MQEKGVKTVLICGLLSQCCVQRTSLGALELGYETILVTDAHSNSGTYPEKNIRKVHKTVEKAGGRLVSIKELNL
ncbi:MAG: isochorismatase family protein [Spirochaetia bacterium]